MERKKIDIKAIKLGLLGDSKVGKTAICRTFVNLDFHTDLLSTIGSDKFETKFHTKEGKEIKLCLLDTAGQERFRSIAFTSIKAVHGIVLVFDVSLKESFDNINMWLELIKDNFEDPCLVIFGNKIDKDKSEWKVNDEDIKTLIDNKHIKYFATSAKTKQGLNEGFYYIVNMAYDKIQAKYNNINNNNDDMITLNKDKDNNDKKKKCGGCSGKK